MNLLIALFVLLLMIFVIDPGDWHRDNDPEKNMEKRDLPRQFQFCVSVPYHADEEGKLDPAIQYVSFAFHVSTKHWFFFGGGSNL